MTILLLSLLLVFAATQPDASGSSAHDCGSDNPGVREIRAVADGIIEADNASDIERVLGYYATDALLMPPNEAPVRGRDAIRPRYEGLFASFVPEIEARIDEACVEGDVGFVRGHNGGRLVGRGSDTARPLDDVYLMLLRRDEDGTWRISHLMWHPASRASRD